MLTDETTTTDDVAPELTTVVYTFSITSVGRDDSTAQITMRAEGMDRCRSWTFQSPETTRAALHNLAEITEFAHLDEMIATANLDSMLDTVALLVSDVPQG